MTEGTAGARTPEYYQGKDRLQPFDIIDAWRLDFYLGNFVKYLIRWKQKGGIEDLGKASHYLDEAVTRLLDGSAASVPAVNLRKLELNTIQQAFGLDARERKLLGFVLRSPIRTCDLDEARETMAYMLIDAQRALPDDDPGLG